MGVAARHIAFQHQYPIFFYGQNYMGVLEAYVGALFFRIGGVSVLTLRLGLVLFFALFLWSLYRLTRTLYTQRFALLVLGLLSLGSSDMFIQQLRAVGGAEETLLFGTLTLLCATWLALHPDDTTQFLHIDKRTWICGGMGLSMGIGLWSHTLILPFLLVGNGILLLFCRQDLRKRGWYLLPLGFLIGVLPLLIYTFQHGANPFTVALDMQRAAGNSSSKVSIFRMLSGTFLYGLPVATGISPVCDSSILPFYGPPTALTSPCVLVHGGWSSGYLLLLTSALLLSGGPLYKLYQRRRRNDGIWSTEERRQAVIHTGRLALLTALMITLFLYVSSPTTALKPWSTRYLIGLLIATPAILWPLWYKASQARKRRAWRRQIGYATILSGILAVFLISTSITINEIPAAMHSAQQDQEIITSLKRHNIKHFYAGYWTCYRLIFASQEQLICDGPDSLKEPIGRRYPPYLQTVQRDAGAAFVFEQSSEDDKIFQAKMRQTAQRYTSFTIDGLDVYVPEAKITP